MVSVFLSVKDLKNKEQTLLRPTHKTHTHKNTNIIFRMECVNFDKPTNIGIKISKHAHHCAVFSIGLKEHQELT